MTKDKGNQICGLCGDQYEGFGNNPHPFVGDRCCDVCNTTQVIPARLSLLFGKKLPGKEQQKNDKG